MKLNIQKALVVAAILSVASSAAKAQFSAYKDGEAVVNMAKTIPDSVTFYFPEITQEPDFTLVGGSVPKVSESIDLGLSVKWAPWNIGASEPSDYGKYFMWGEVSPKKDVDGIYGNYYWDTYCFYNQSAKQTIMFKYNDADGKTTLEPSDDAATANWVGKWRMPTQAELAELSNEDNCVWTWTDNYNESGHCGYVVKSKKAGYEGAVLFLPAAGLRRRMGHGDEGSIGYYWSSGLYPGNSYYARNLYFEADYCSADYESDRCIGFSVRAVCTPAE